MPIDIVISTFIYIIIIIRVGGMTRPDLLLILILSLYTDLFTLKICQNTDFLPQNSKVFLTVSLVIHIFS